MLTIAPENDNEVLVAAYYPEETGASSVLLIVIMLIAIAVYISVSQLNNLSLYTWCALVCFILLVILVIVKFLFRNRYAKAILLFQGALVINTYFGKNQSYSYSDIYSVNDCSDLEWEFFVITFNDGNITSFAKTDQAVKFVDELASCRKSAKV